MFHNTLDGRLISIDAKTGKAVMETERVEGLNGVYASPVTTATVAVGIVDGMVYLGTGLLSILIGSIAPVGDTTATLPDGQALTAGGGAGGPGGAVGAGGVASISGGVSSWSQTTRPGMGCAA